MGAQLLKTEFIGSLPLLTTPDDRFGTDQIFLGSFARFEPSESVLDLGAGCGILAFIALSSGCRAVTAAEIRPEACELMRRSAQMARVSSAEPARRFDVLSERAPAAELRVVQTDIRDFDPDERFDAVVCNPPYFRLGSGYSHSTAAGRTQREENELTFADVAACADRCLAPGGRFVYCMRPERFAETLMTAAKAGFYPERIRFAAHSPGKRPFVFAASLRRAAASCLFEPTEFME